MTMNNIINKIQENINIYNENHIPNHMDSNVLMQIFGNTMVLKAGKANANIIMLAAKAEDLGYKIYLHKTYLGFYDIFAWKK